MASYIAMDLVHGYKPKGHDGKGGKSLHVGEILRFHGGDKHLVIIRFPHSWVMKFIARVVLLAFVVISLPRLGSMIGEFNSKFHGGNASENHGHITSDPVKVETLPLLFRDFTNEGLLKMGDRALFVSNGDKDEEAIYNSQILRASGMDVISYSDSERQGMIPDETFDFAFVHGIHANAKFIDRVVKVGGTVVVQINGNPKVNFQKLSNYNIVYLRQLDDSTIMAMRQVSHNVNDNNKISSPARKLLGLTPEAKEAALKKLEDVLLEPPRSASGKSNTYLKKTRYLPDLMEDSLESYPRRVFINVAGDAGWFEKHYPTRNNNFEIYEVETVPETTMAILPPSSNEETVAYEMSDWLRKTVKEEDYVVMKAEAEVVEEMVRSKTLKLVDELFLECKGKKSTSRRPYWECLALYGMLRDEGVAVHQWWG